MQSRMHEMDERAVYSHVVGSEVRIGCDVKDIYPFEICSCDRDEAHYTLRRTCIELFIILWLVYHVNMFDSEWINGTCLGKEVCNVLNLVENRSGHQFIGK